MPVVVEATLLCVGDFDAGARERDTVFRVSGDEESVEEEEDMFDLVKEGSSIFSELVCDGGIGRGYLPASDTSASAWADSDSDLESEDAREESEDMGDGVMTSEDVDEQEERVCGGEEEGNVVVVPAVVEEEEEDMFSGKRDDEVVYSVDKIKSALL